MQTQTQNNLISVLSDSEKRIFAGKTPSLKKTPDFARTNHRLQPSWLRDFSEMLDVYWLYKGKGKTRQAPYIGPS